MKKICIVSPEGFPVPATKGGAIETLINNIIDENEKKKKIEIICVARYEKEARKQSKKYRNTKILYFKLPKEKSLLDKTLNLLYRILKKVTKRNWKNIIHSMRIYNKIKKFDIDYIVVEGRRPYVL
ncbi:MAG: hypothetical protein HFJ20_00455 [Clostridia bacterium]|nr:hypothetical protein [Clostridia bacterium]